MGARPVCMPCGAHRCSMLSAFSTSKAWPLVAMLTTGMVVVALVGCQLHTDSHDQMQAYPAGHHRAPSSHTTFDLTCVVATLSSVTSLLPVYLCTPYTMDLVASPTGFAFPLFIPPEARPCVRTS